MNGQTLQRGWALLEQNRPDLALDQAKLALTQDTADASAHQLLTLASVYQQRYWKEKDLGQALESAHSAVQLAPDAAFSHFVLSAVLVELQAWDKAATAISAALDLDPASAEYWNQSAIIHMHFGRWQAAMEEIERGLQQDPENTTLQSNRVRCLISMGRKEDVKETMESALRRNPDDADVHVSQAYALLHAGRYKEAMKHYGEALRIDPTSEAARQGMLEAMRARNPIYALLLRFFLWMTRFSRKSQIWLWVGGIMLVKALRAALQDTQPGLAIGIGVAWFSFVALTWVAHPLANLILRLDRDGRHMLSDEEVGASNVVGALVLAALALAALALLLPRTELFFAAATCVFLMLPVNAMFTASRKPMCIFYTAYWSVMLLFQLAAITLLLLPFQGLAGAAIGCLVLVLLATLAFTWIIAIAESRS